MKHLLIFKNWKKKLDKHTYFLSILKLQTFFHKSVFQQNFFTRLKKEIIALSFMWAFPFSYIWLLLVTSDLELSFCHFCFRSTSKVTCTAWASSCSSCSTPSPPPWSEAAQSRVSEIRQLPQNQNYFRQVQHMRLVQMTKNKIIE